MARHEKHVRTGFDLVRQRLVIPKPDGDVIGIIGGGLLQPVFVVKVAGPQHHQVHIPGGQFRGDFNKQLGALLAGEP